MLDCFVSRLRSVAAARGGERGATTTEFVIIMPLFFVILFGIIEAAFIFRTRATLNTATFDAARHGAVSHALVSPMNERLARGMIPLYMQGSTDPLQYTEAYARARIMVSAADGVGLDPVRVVSPTQAMVEEFGVPRTLQLPGDSWPTEYQVIPNDNLSYRPASTVEVDIDGESRPINVQDANLLKIKSYWCHPLIVPVVNRLIAGLTTLDLFNPSPEQLACEALSAAEGGHHIPVTSQATVRMQSDVVRRDLN